MDELLGQLVRVVAVFLSGEAHEAVVVNVNFQRVEAGDKNVDAQVVLQAVDQVGIG